MTPIDLATGTPGTPVTVGFAPHGIAITPDGSTAYVADEFANTVTPIDLATNTAETSIPVGNDPLSIAVTPDGATAYVANYGNNTVTPIDLTADTPETPIPCRPRTGGGRDHPQRINRVRRQLRRRHGHTD